MHHRVVVVSITYHFGLVVALPQPSIPRTLSVLLCVGVVRGNGLELVAVIVGTTRVATTNILPIHASLPTYPQPEASRQRHTSLATALLGRVIAGEGGSVHSNSRTCRVYRFNLTYRTWEALRTAFQRWPGPLGYRSCLRVAGALSRVRSE